MIREFLDGRCAARGDAPFLRYRGRSWSYADLAAITDGAAAALQTLGVGAGDRVATLLPNGPPQIFVWLALAKLGAVTAPLHPQLTAAEAAGQLAFLEPKGLVMDASLPGACPPPASCVFRLDAVEDLPGLLGTRGAPRTTGAAGDGTADILMTSGTTGRPKGVIQTWRTYVITGEGFAHWLRLREDDRLFTCLPMSHINARAYSVMGALAAGASLAIEERFSASRFWGWIAESEATQANAIGAMLQILLRAPVSPADRAHRLRLLYSAPALGEAAHREFERRFGVRLVIGYGLTESTFGFIHPLDGERRLDTMGKIRRHPDPGIGNEVRLVDPDTGTDVAEGEAGEILLRNQTVFTGYFRDEAATRETLGPDGWLRTGDLARRDPDGWYTFVGRRREIIRRRGENIAPAEVESALMSHPSVREAAVVGLPSDLGEEEVAAFVVLEAGPPAPGAVAAAEAALREHAAARLAAFKVPTIWRFPGTLPRTPTQRIARHLLR